MIKLHSILYLIIIFWMSSCKPNTPVKENNSDIEIKTATKNGSSNEKKSSKDSNEVKILVLPSVNSYDFNTLGYDLDAILSKNLSDFPEMQIIKFPYRKLVGTNTSGIYTSKDAAPIIRKVESEVIIMSRFIGESPELGPPDYKWAYEVKILNPKNLKSRISIKGKNLDSYVALQNHIKDNIDLLILDIYEIHQDI